MMAVETYLSLIPEDPFFVPPEKARERAETRFEFFGPRASEIRILVTDTPDFIFPAQNWDGVYCRECDADLNEWLGEALKRTEESHFTSLNSTLPCCGCELSLNDLRYGETAGFARFVLQAWCVSGIDRLPPRQHEELEALLGCKLRQVWSLS